MNRSPITILIGALGGEGGGVLAQWLVEAATRAGYPAQSTSIPGVAQRTGATTYYVEVFPETVESLGGRRPVLSLLPVPGRIDLAIASELLEAGRIVANGMVSPDRTLLVASTSRTLTTAEKMSLGDGRFDPDRLLDVARAQSAKLVAFDMEAAARDAGTVVSAVMMGSVAGSGVLPLAGRRSRRSCGRRDAAPTRASPDSRAAGTPCVPTQRRWRPVPPRLRPRRRIRGSPRFPRRSAISSPPDTRALSNSRTPPMRTHTSHGSRRCSRRNGAATPPARAATR